MNKKSKTKITNINFIASYIFRYPGCSGAVVRRALYYSKHQTLDGFNERRWARSYFYKPVNHRGYPKKYWQSPKRGKWIITPIGLEKVKPELFMKIDDYRKKCAKIIKAS